jgi:hypothetical protein
MRNEAGDVEERRGSKNNRVPRYIAPVTHRLCIERNAATGEHYPLGSPVVPAAISSRTSDRRFAQRFGQRKWLAVRWRHRLHHGGWSHQTAGLR